MVTASWNEEVYAAGERAVRLDPERLEDASRPKTPAASSEDDLNLLEREDEFLANARARRRPAELCRPARAAALPKREPVGAAVRDL